MTERTERIAAYLDGAMEEIELAAFEAELDRDPGLADEVARYLANDDLLRAAFDAPMQQPVDETLLERMGLAEPKASTPVAANDNPSFWHRWQWPVGGAIAASLALIMLLQTGRSESETDFAAAMDATPSSRSVELADGSTITPRITFKAGDGQFCREFLQSSAAGSETGIACRNGGDWRVEAKVRGGSALQDPGQITSAAGEDGSSLDDVYARLGASDPLAADAERELIANRWSQR